MSILQRELTNYQGESLEILDEAIVCQISIKKAYFVVVYRSPSQTADEFNLFLDRSDQNSLWKLFKLKDPTVLL